MSLRSIHASLRLPAAACVIISLLLSGVPAGALGLRVYNSTSHDRFVNFPSDLNINTGHIFSSVDLTGIGFRTNADPTRQAALVGRQHVLFATHYRDQLNSATLTFINSNNQIITRTCGAQTIIYSGGVPTDLVLVQLNAPIDSDSGIRVLPYYDAANINNANLGVTGKDNTSSSPDQQFPVLGKATVELDNINLQLVQTVGGQAIVTKAYRFDYANSPFPPNSGDDSDCFLEVGDSGSPSFVQVGDVAALIGVHSAIIAVSGGVQNYDTHVFEYIAQLDAVLNPLGYRMRPHSIPATTLAGSGAFPTATPRKAMALDYEYTIENTGSETAGNVEIQLDFASGEGPDSVTASGWVTYGSGDRWTLRRSTLAATGGVTLQASWSAAPSTDTLEFTVTHRSDASGEVVDNESLALADSYADWASVLTLKALGDDEDGDEIVNLVEYALGGDPTVSSRDFTGGGPLLPVIGTDATTVTLTHPERTDKVVRGLGYALEFSTTLSSWNTTAPAGFSSSTVPYEPDVPGFVQRRCSWSRGSGGQFVRLVMTLSE